MTSSPAPDRPTAAGVFVVRDPAVCAALEQLLAPHRTDPSPSGGDAAAVAALMADAEAYAAELTDMRPDHLPEQATIDTLLALVHAEGLSTGREQAATEGREWSERQTSLVSEMEKQVEQLQADLTDALKQLEAARQHRARAQEKVTELHESKVDLESNLAHAEHRITELEQTLAKAKAPTPAAPKPVDGRTARGKDRAAFVALADRMDRESLSQPKTIAVVLRTAAKSVRDEIDTVYGDAGRTAS